MSLVEQLAAFVVKARWEALSEKFELLSSQYAETDLQRSMVDTVASLDSQSVNNLTSLLRKVRVPNSRRAGAMGEWIS